MDSMPRTGGYRQISALSDYFFNFPSLAVFFGKKGIGFGYIGDFEVCCIPFERFPRKMCCHIAELHRFGQWTGVSKIIGYGFT